MLFTVGHEVRQYRSWSKDYSDLIAVGERADALNVDPLRQLVYWTDTALKHINRAVLPKDGNVSTVAQALSVGGLVRPEGLSIDWVAE